jgi:hypothetical protein
VNREDRPADLVPKLLQQERCLVAVDRAAVDKQVRRLVHDDAAVVGVEDVQGRRHRIVRRTDRRDT